MCFTEYFNAIRIISENDNEVYVEVTKEIGVEALVKALKNNDEKGIKYHTTDGSKGAYDSLESKEKIKELLVMGLEKG